MTNEGPIDPIVWLYDVMGSDRTVVNAARVSLQSDDIHAGIVLNEADEKLIGFLMREGHMSPFEHVVFTFKVRAPITVIRQWQRHRIGSFNEISGRYSVIEDPEFYVPNEVRTQVGKPGSYTYAPLDEKKAAQFQKILKGWQELGAAAYKTFLAAGVAKEQARFFLAPTLYTEMFWTVNARSLMNFLTLRNSEHAQAEIRAYAVEIEKYFRETVPVTAAAFRSQESAKK